MVYVLVDFQWCKKNFVKAQAVNSKTIKTYVDSVATLLYEVKRIQEHQMSMEKGLLLVQESVSKI